MTEPLLVDESEFTAYAEPGWQSWNGMSPEREFAEFAATLARMTRPALTIETGVGQGFTTRRLAEAATGRVLCFESDDAWRTRISVPSNAVLSFVPTPSAQQFAAADLTVLDSDVPFRLAELESWKRHAQPRSLLLVHDCGNGHGDDTPHIAIRNRIIELGIAGTFLGNPRGGFLGVQT